ncbi:MAG: hypothetical protein HY846_03110 [Nitrosomonadales bacterium]|nr:hypothetical protein [Nitrosomonadales bacterium]
MRKLMSIFVIGLLAATLLAGCARLQNIKGELASGQNQDEQKFDHFVTASRAIPGVSVWVTYQGGAVYHLEVGNTLPNVISLLWDESVYVDTKGESVRILHIPKMSDLPRDPPAQQASPPIAPDSRFRADFIGEKWLDAVRRGASPTPRDSTKKARLYLAFSIKGKRVEWQGEITFVPPRKPECDQKLASCSPATITLPQP